MLARSSSVTRSSASRLKTQSWLADSAANCFCAAKPGQSRTITRAPQASAISAVSSFERESTTRISSAQATDWHAARMFSASLKVMMVAEIFKASEDTQTGAQEQRVWKEKRAGVRVEPPTPALK